jgi:hypothetical protein
MEKQDRILKNVCVQVIEQTEFIDDASFQPFRASGKQVG